MENKSSFKLASGAVWVCSGCHVWWGSQVGKRPKTRLLLQISKSGFMPYDWDVYHGWRYTQESTSQSRNAVRRSPRLPW